MSLDLTSRRLLYLGYVILICAGILLPSDGQHGFFSIKSLAFAFLGVLLLSYMSVQRRLSMYDCKLLFFFCVI